MQLNFSVEHTFFSIRSLILSWFRFRFCVWVCAHSALCDVCVLYWKCIFINGIFFSPVMWLSNGGNYLTSQDWQTFEAFNRIFPTFLHSNERLLPPNEWNASDAEFNAHTYCSNGHQTLINYIFVITCTTNSRFQCHLIKFHLRYY